jgi:hypothetical protein
MKKKLIEVALPLEAINEASARKKSIRHGHPSTLHLWWARRPLAVARAVIFAQMVDDPSTYVDVLRSDAKIKRKAESLLKARRKTWKDAKALAQRAAGTTANVPEPGPSPRRSSPTSSAHSTRFDHRFQRHSSTACRVIRPGFPRSCDRGSRSAATPGWALLRGGGGVGQRLGPALAQRLALEGEAVGVVDQAVEDGVSQRRVADEVVPVLDR